MPLRRPPPPVDLERVARLLGSGSRTRAGGRRVDPGDGGWVPGPPSREAPAASAPAASAPADDDVALLDAQLRRARRPALLTLPDDVRDGRRAVSAPAVLAVVALVVALACVYGVRVLLAERGAGGAPRPVGAVAPPTGAVVTTGPRPAPTGVASGAGASSAAVIVVHVVGLVARPGLVRLPAGSRVADALAAAGGARPGADLAAVNLARVLVDGEQLHVPRPGETPPAGSVAAQGGPGAAAAPGAPVDLNTADVAALDTLPGVGPVLAQRIVDWRSQHGRFSTVDELGEVSGIGDRLMAQLRPRVTV